MIFYKTIAISAIMLFFTGCASLQHSSAIEADPIHAAVSDKDPRQIVQCIREIVFDLNYYRYDNLIIPNGFRLIIQDIQWTFIAIDITKNEDETQIKYKSARDNGITEKWKNKTEECM